MSVFNIIYFTSSSSGFSALLSRRLRRLISLHLPSTFPYISGFSAQISLHLPFSHVISVDFFSFESLFSSLNNLVQGTNLGLRSCHLSWLGTNVLVVAELLLLLRFSRLIEILKGDSAFVSLRTSFWSPLFIWTRSSLVVFVSFAVAAAYAHLD